MSNLGDIEVGALTSEARRVIQAGIAPGLRFLLDNYSQNLSDQLDELLNFAAQQLLKK